jgi:hypothetical protein
MPIYTVHEAADPPSDRFERAERLDFVKDGFSWMAALFAPIWMLVYRLWWPLLGYVVVIAVLSQLTDALSSRWTTLALVAMHLLTGLEAGTLRRWQLARRGWRAVGSVTGRTADECERRFFDVWLPAQAVVVAVPGGPAGGEARRALPSSP